MVEDACEGQRAVSCKLERNIDMYVALHEKGRRAHVIKYDNDPGIFWEIHCFDGGEFVICVDRRELTVCTFRQPGRRLSVMEKQFENYICEIMGNGIPWLVHIDIRPS